MIKIQFPVKCPICGKSLLDRRLAKIHFIRKHKLSKLDAERLFVDIVYGKENVDKEIERYKRCECCITGLKIDIALLLKLLGLKRSSSEERHTERYKREYLNSIQKKYGKNITNISQVLEIQKKKEETYAKTYGSYDNYLKNCISMMKAGSKRFWADKERRSTMLKHQKETYMSLWGVDNPSKVDYIKEKMSLSQKERNKAKSLEEKRRMTEKARLIVTSNGSISSLERRVWNIMDMWKMCYRHNKFLFGYSWDLIFDDEKILIEIQGDFYHANPSKYKSGDVLFIGLSVDEIWKKDEIKRIIAEENGYKVYYLWETELNSMTDKEVMEFICDKIMK